MKNTRKWLFAFLVSVLFICCVAFGITAYSRTYSGNGMDMDDEVRSDAVYTLNGYLGMEDNSSAGGREASVAEHNIDDGVGRLTQRVTIVSDGNVLPISGTVTKMQDAFYPGTYVVRFSNKAILTSEATVKVRIDVAKDDQVYILTGDKDKGYTQVEVVTADEDNCVTFDTSVIQDYTISKTDIISAQAAMASVMAN